MNKPWRATSLALAAAAWFAASAPAVPPKLANDVLPLLKTRCVRCHGPAEQEGGLNLSLPQTIARGGDSGGAILPGNVDESLLWQRVVDDEMPPDEPLPDDEKATLRAWIAAGAAGLPSEVADAPDGDEHWAFQPFVDASPPAVKDEAATRTGVDRFVQSRLEEAGLSIGREADRVTLVRRVAFDLTGLPPSLDEINAYVDDPANDAYERMVDRFLESPHYGERWGKHWLDAAGYADSNGYFAADTDRPLAWRYRDYVIAALNADKPFDQFIREQLAGDQLSGYRPDGPMRPETVEMLTATHFLRNSPDGTDSSDGNPDELRADRYAVLDGALQIVGSSLLGVTVQCARCHDHKFEPFPQADYFSLQAIIYPAFNVETWVTPRNRQLSASSADEVAAWERNSKAVDERIAARRAEFHAWLSEHRERGQELFSAHFDSSGPLADAWSNAAPGDAAPAGQPGVNIDSTAAPGAYIDSGRLRIVESRDDGDRAFSTRASFDWTPDEPGDWIQVTFDLVGGGDTAPYVGYFIALTDFNDTTDRRGGNILIDGNADGKATIHVDYPGGDSDQRGQIGQSGYQPGRSYGVRVVNAGDGKFELSQVVDGVVEEGSAALAAADLPDGGFGFEYCCGRSFVVDNVVVEMSDQSLAEQGDQRALAELRNCRRAELDAEIAEIERQRGERPPMLAAVTDLANEPPVVRLLHRGDPKSPGDIVAPAAPTVLGEPTNPASLASSDSSAGARAGSRLAFAQWLTRPESRAAARLARVTANRWWQHHFGAGLVATPDNLGYSGAAPTHPELLDYLATQLARRGWSAKEFHREILHSAVYRQTSAPRADGQRIDPTNRLLWRFPLRRLDAEAIRDAMLAASGELDKRRGGSYVPTVRDEDGDVVVDEQVDGALRRSVYLQQRRTQVLGMLEVFDAPSITFNCTQRLPTTIPLQSLKLMNSAFVRNRAAALAARAAADADSDAASRVERVFLLAIGRRPTDDESSDARQFLDAQAAEYAAATQPVDAAWTDLCQAILSSNDFLYVR